MKSESGLVTYWKDYINTSLFLSDDDTTYEFLIDLWD